MIRNFVLATLLLGSTSALAGPMMKPSPAVSVDTRAKKPIVPFCVGKLNGNYWTAVSLLARMNRDVTVDPKTTQGALDNTELVDNGTCPFGLTQADTLREYRETHPGAEMSIQRISALYREYGFLLCNRRANIKTVKDLHKGHVVAVGPGKSGSASTWEGLVATDKARFTDVKTSDQGDLDALTAVADGSEVSCMFVTGGIGNTLLKQQAPRMASKVVLVPLTDSDFSKIKDAKGDSVYRNESIPKATYSSLMPSGWFGNKDYPTFSTQSVIIVNKDWKEAHPDLYTSVLGSINAAMPAMVKAAEPTQ